MGRVSYQSHNRLFSLSDREFPPFLRRIALPGRIDRILLLTSAETTLFSEYTAQLLRSAFSDSDYQLPPVFNLVSLLKVRSVFLSQIMAAFLAHKVYDHSRYSLWEL